MVINSLEIRNLRCFSEVKSLIRPITIIVGENNTGKTTFLASYQLIHDLLYKDKPIKPLSIGDLLKDPIYKYLGGSEGILRKQSGSDIINIGAMLQIGKDKWDIEYSIKKGEVCNKILINCSEDNSENNIEINIEENIMIRISVNKQEEYKDTMPLDFDINFFHIISFLSNNLKTLLEENKILHSKITSLLKLQEEWKKMNCHLFNPINLEPKKQYDPSRIETTDSSYILCEMAQMKKKKAWNEIEEKLKKFGKDSSLFQGLDIDILNKENKFSPFSIKVKVDELESNITNVGYGVNQFLPIFGNMLISDQEKYNTFLIQQPEVHLHPKVEAEFATLMINMINEHDKKYRFICETHSDYIIKRSSIEIKKKNLNPEAFLILYFELKNGVTKIHPITIDSNGNLENQPDSYTDFFLQEDYELLGLED